MWHIFEKYKYLGCVLNEFLDYTSTSKILSDAASRALGSVVTKLKSNKGLLYLSYTKLYDTCVSTIINYGAAVWGYKNYDKPNTIHNRAIRTYLGVHRFSSNIAINGEMGWVTPKVRRHLDIIRLWYRIVKMDNNRLPKKIMLWDREQNRSTWSKEVKQIFINMDMLNEYESLNASQDLSQVLKHAEDTFMNFEINCWKNNLGNQTKLRTYRLMKDTFNTEEYVKMDLPFSYRSFIAQTRCGILPLKIETGRFTQPKTPVDERLCIFCDLKEVEDEEHFILNCPLYLPIRLLYLNHIQSFYPQFSNLSVSEKLKTIFTDPKIIRRTGWYIQNAYLKRNNHIFV